MPVPPMSEDAAPPQRSCHCASSVDGLVGFLAAWQLEPGGHRLQSFLELLELLVQAFAGLTSGVAALEPNCRLNS